MSDRINPWSLQCDQSLNSYIMTQFRSCIDPGRTKGCSNEILPWQRKILKFTCAANISDSLNVYQMSDLSIKVCKSIRSFSNLELIIFKIEFKKTIIKPCQSHDYDFEKQTY